MENLSFYVPTTVHFDKGQIRNLASSIKLFGGTKYYLPMEAVVSGKMLSTMPLWLD